MDEEDCTIHTAWKFLWSTSQRIGFWCQHNWFGLLGPTRFCQINQSNATLWVRNTCLIVGLLPLIVLITASLSSKNTTVHHNEKKLRLWSRDLDLTTVQHCGYLFANMALDMHKQFPTASLKPLLFPEASWVGDMLFSVCNTFNTKSHKSRGGIPSILNPASTEIVSDSVELWETDVCFLHIQLIGITVWLPKMHNVPPDVDFESSRSPAKSESWKRPNR